MSYRALAAEKRITEKVYFDLTLDGQGVGRVVIGLYGDVVPRTAENFASLGNPKNFKHSHSAEQSCLNLCPFSSFWKRVQSTAILRKALFAL